MELLLSCSFQITKLCFFGEDWFSSLELDNPKNDWFVRPKSKWIQIDKISEKIIKFKFYWYGLVIQVYLSATFHNYCSLKSKNYCFFLKVLNLAQFNLSVYINWSHKLEFNGFLYVTTYHNLERTYLCFSCKHYNPKLLS